MKKLYASIIALSLTLVALGTGVFAWFTINNTASASGFEGTVQAAEGGFLVSIDKGATWTNSIDLADALKGQLKPFKDITTKDGIDFATVDGKKSNDYISFTIKFAAINFTKVEAKTTITGDTTSWNSEYAFTTPKIAQGTTLVSSAANALRVAYVQGTAVTKYIEATEDYAGTGTVAGTQFKNTLGIPAEADNFALAYYNKAKGTDTKLPTGLLSQDAKKRALSGDVVEIAALTNGEAPTGYAEYTNTGEVTVNIWIEGWDAESFNAILSGKVQVSIEFTAK